MSKLQNRGMPLSREVNHNTVKAPPAPSDSTINIGRETQPTNGGNLALRAVNAGEIQLVVLNRLDRFDTNDPHQLTE